MWFRMFVFYSVKQLIDPIPDKQLMMKKQTNKGYVQPTDSNKTPFPLNIQKQTQNIRHTTTAISCTGGVIWSQKLRSSDQGAAESQHRVPAQTPNLPIANAVQLSMTAPPPPVPSSCMASKLTGHVTH